MEEDKEIKMNLIVIVGAGAVGKMTVGQELMKITDYRLFHNHMMIEPVIEIFGKFNGAVVNKLRETIFDEFIRSENMGMIFTFMWAFDMQSDWDYITALKDRFEQSGGTVYFVELVADQSVRLERNRTENRLQNKASKRNVALSDERIIREDTKYRLESMDGEVAFPNYIKIDNSTLTAQETAMRIKECFNLPDKKTGVFDDMKIEPVLEHEIETYYKMQVESFLPLYEKYHDDETSPAKESFSRIKEKYYSPIRRYMFLVYKGARVGAVCVCNKDPNDNNIFFIAPIFILPQFQNQGLGYAFLQMLFNMFPYASKWKLDTILEEKANVHLYEKCGFVRIGEPHRINDKMTIIDYEKIV